MLNKDFYHVSAGTIEVKSNTPNNVAFKVTGKSSHEKNTSGAVRLHLGPIILTKTQRHNTVQWRVRKCNVSIPGWLTVWFLYISVCTG